MRARSVLVPNIGVDTESWSPRDSCLLADNFECRLDRSHGSQEKEGI